jgi:hypothetical protein
MKTHVFKNSESANITIYDVLFASIIVFAGILLFAANNRQSFMGDGSVNARSKQDFFKNETMKNPASATEFSMEKMYEYLIPEAEPELEVGNLSSVVFPDVEMVKLTAADNTLGTDYFLKDLQNLANEKTNEAVKLYALEMTVKENLIPENEPLLETGNANSIIIPDVEMVKLTEADNTLGTDYFLKDLQNLANEKTNEAVEFYALEMKAKKCLTVETELPLQMENWMFNEKCWCTEFSEPMALSEGK